MATSPGPGAPGAGSGGPGGGAVLLLGAPGVGKSALGRLLASRAPPGSRFLSVGEELRAEGLVRRQEEAPSAARRVEMREAAAELLRGACREWREARSTSASGASTSASSPAPSASLLLLECVKDTEDAFAAVEVLAAEGVPLLQALYIPHNIATTHDLKAAIAASSSASSPSTSSAARDRERRVAERQAKWAAHAGRVLELYSALGVLSELTVWRGPNAGRSPDKPSLAAMGYAAGPAAWEPLRPSPAEIAWEKARLSLRMHLAGKAAPAPALKVPDGPPPPPWLAASGLRLPAGLACTPLQPVTSARLVTSRSERDRVLAEAARESGLRLDGFFRGALSGGPALPVPTSSVDTAATARWVGWLGRYAVSRKADGTRYLLVVLSDGPAGDFGGGSGGGSTGTSCSAYLLNRVGSLYKFPIRRSAPADGNGGAGVFLPVGTLLDGELVWVGRRAFFLAFDVLCVGGRRLWSRPLRERLAALEGGSSGGGSARGLGLGLAEAEECEGLKAAAASVKAQEPTAQQPVAAAALPAAYRLCTVNLAPVLSKKQQAPSPASGGNVLCVLRKRHLGVTAEALRELGASTSACPYPTDGLIFTPYDMPYVLGMAELSYKWQPAEQVRVDLRGAELLSARVLSELVYECRSVTDSRSRFTRHVPVDVRWDKTGGNAPAAVRRLTAQRRECESLEALARSVGEAVGSPEGTTSAAAQGGDNSEAEGEQEEKHGQLGDSAWERARHPASAMRYDELYDSVVAAVAAGSVERTVDSDSGLEIFNYRPGAPLGPVEALCRGLVLHPPSATLVATPFAKFQELDTAARPRRRRDPSEPGSCAVCGCSAEVDEEGERICYCDSCAVWGCVTSEELPELLAALDRQRRRKRREQRLLGKNSCRVCGCSVEVDEDGERVCHCDSCARRGCMPSMRERSAGPDGEADVKLLERWGCSLRVESDVEPSAWELNPRDLITSAAPGGGSGGGGGCPAAASVKVDGSMVVAFTWGGQLRTATRRRMDSEQAVWAGDWLRRNANPSAFQPGWTYMLEAVYGNSTVVVPYAFEGLVLLSAVDPEGREVPRRELPALAQVLGVTMAVPCVEGELEELLWGLPRERHVTKSGPAPAASSARQAVTKIHPSKDSPGPPPAFEGCVVSAPDSRRYKLVQQPYKGASWAGRLLHPLSVWDRVCHGGSSFAALNEGLPGHFRAELDAILAALAERYSEARAELLRVLRAAARVGRLAELKGPDASDEAGDTLAALLSQLNLDDGQAAAGRSAPTSAAVAAVTAPMASSAAAVGADLLSCPHFRRALSRAADRLLAGALPAGSEVPEDLVPPSMYYVAPPPPSAAARALAAAAAQQPAQQLPDPLLRGALLRCFKPGSHGSLPGYTPSPGFAQTWAKGWAQGPVGRMDPSAPPPLLQTALFDELLERCLAPLQGRDLAAALLVCERWRRVLRAVPPPGDLAARLEAGRRAAEEARAAEAAERRRRHAFRDSSSDDDEPYLRDIPSYGDGYGSY